MKTTVGTEYTITTSTGTFNGTVQALYVWGGELFITFDVEGIGYGYADVIELGDRYTIPANSIKDIKSY